MIDELKAKRTSLYEQLNTVIDEMEPLKERERRIRRDILDVQEKLFVLEMPKCIKRRQTLVDASEDDNDYKRFMEKEIKIFQDQVDHLKVKYEMA